MLEPLASLASNQETCFGLACYTRNMRKFVPVLKTLLLLALCLPTFAEKPATTLADYVRYTKTSPGKLETSVVSLRSPAGQNLDLVAAVHLGEAAYYKALNTRFQSYDAVLYELILPEEMAGQPLPAEMDTGSGLSGFQGMMARTMGMTTQIGNIDYSAKNFVHADLTMEGLTAAMDARQESMWTYLQKLLMDSGSSAATQADLGVTNQELADLDLFAIMSGKTTAKDRKVLKKLMATVMSSPDGAMNGLEDTALLTERNKAALKVVDAQSKAGKRRMALYYGAAHMPDLEAKLTAKGWKRTGVDWLQAWTI